MSFLYLFKPHKDRALHSTCRMLHSAGITPNMVTTMGLLMSVMAGVVAASGHIFAGVIIFIIGAGMDAVDGSLAREYRLITEFGQYFDSICDRLSEMVFITGAVIGGASSMALLVIAGSVLLLVSRIDNHRKGFRSDVAMFGRPERLALLITGLLSPYPVSVILFVMSALLCLVSSLQILISGAKSGERNENIIRGGTL